MPDTQEAPVIDVLAHEIQTEHRAGRMLEALVATENKRAKLTLTTEVRDANGAKRMHQTFEIRGWQGRAGKMLTVSVAGTGSYHEGIQPIKVMHLDLATCKILDARDPRNADRLLRYAAEAAVAFAWLGEAGLPTPTNGSVVVTEASNCIYCGRELTDPVSQKRGSGEDCYGKATGTKTIRSRKVKTSETINVGGTS